MVATYSESLAFIGDFTVAAYYIWAFPTLRFYNNKNSLISTVVSLFLQEPFGLCITAASITTVAFEHCVLRIQEVYGLYGP